MELAEIGHYDVPRRSDGDRRLRAVALTLGAIFTAYCGVTVAGAPRGIVSALFNVFMAPVPVVAWWAYVRAPADLRRPIYVLAWAATFWLLGTLVWYGYYVAGGSVVPAPPGTWDIFFVLARVVVIVAIGDTLKSVISFRIAALDASVICAAAVAVGAAFV